jgi:hypothetical protein
MNIYEQSKFRPVNTDVDAKRGGYRPGRIGVSDFQGKMLNYNRPGVNPLPLGAGVSPMTQRPQQMTKQDPGAYNLYKKEPIGDLYKNFYK